VDRKEVGVSVRNLNDSTLDKEELKSPSFISHRTSYNYGA
jgi:hypothetical protein